jgi:uncharacterized caspase-like protein
MVDFHLRSAMPQFLKSILVLLALMPAFGLAGGAAHAEKRIALVIGNAGYQTGALNTPANDAGLIAQTLQASGFDVVGARDLDQDSLRRAFRDFLDKASASGPDTVAFVYLAGYGLQLEAENYFVPIDARIARGSLGTDRAKSARAALERTAKALNGRSPTTLAPDTKSLASADVIPLKS